MKTKIFSIILVMIIALTTPGVGVAYVNAAEQQSLSYEAAAAYKTVIDEAIKKYGEYSVKQYGGVGVGLARLIDFDGNGTLELLIGCGHGVQGDEYFYEVYEYDNGISMLTHTYCCNSMQLSFDLQMVKSGNSVYAVTASDGICDGYIYYGTVSGKQWQVTEYYSHYRDLCDYNIHPELAGKDVYMINGNMASEMEAGYMARNAKYASYDADPYSEYVMFGEKGTEITINTLNDIISNNSNEFTGTLQECFIKDAIGDDIQCFVLKLDTPQSLRYTDMFGEKCDASNVTEFQVVIKNYTPFMDGARVRIVSYDELFEGHTAYHIRPIVMNGAMVELMDKDIAVTIDGEKVLFDQQPIAVNGRVMVPMRAIFEKLGATVSWDGNTQTITSTKGDTIISMTLGKNVMYKNEKAITLDVAPIAQGGRTLVPVRAVAEAFDCKVDWDGDNSTVVITG